MKVCVIGAGAAGLCAIRHALAFGCEVVAFEQSDKIGGTWVYSEATGKDKHGNNIHSSMYKGLHTNLPKELMSFPDFPFPPHEKSFLPAKDIDDYLNLYAGSFKLRDHIKFEHHVIRVRPIEDGKAWEVIVLDFPRRKYEKLVFDGILVCNGHFSTPSFPNYQDSKKFMGRKMHSHDYRMPNRFTGKKVLIVGAGPSGVDITQEIAQFADKVLWSNHSSASKRFQASNIIDKPDVARLIEEGAAFVDGSIESFDEIVYCTGYKYTFPFLSVDCGVFCDDNYVRPLYKHCLSCNNPRMGLIGLPFYVCPFQMFDLQIRFCLTFMTGRSDLPSKDEMLRDTEWEMNGRWLRGLKRSKAHSMGTGYQDQYFAELASGAGVAPVKPVVLKMFDVNKRNQAMDFANYRRYTFRAFDDESFETFISP